ncbi:BlaI/MecI/CopY family transcriptional regulator [Lachnospiraceae bacterium 29-84]
MSKKEDFALSKRELDVMNVLWSVKEPMIASEIPKNKPDLSINTVQAVLKKLMQKGFVRVEKIVHSGTVLTRSYSASVSAEEYAVGYVKCEIFPFGKIVSKAGLVDHLFDIEEDKEGLVKELERIIEERKKKE